ncbi:MAG: HNH endonuclease [Anaerosomatales bacterium]|nr:HNH endonuclease [Anaerosomatales bacterium]
MPSIQTGLSKIEITQEHLDVLLWFEQHEGEVFRNRPQDVGLHYKVSAPQFGIWKPGDLKYALSVMQSHRRVYADLPPYEVDGTWVYQYHQEGTGIDDRLGKARNRALDACREAGLPVGVLLAAPEYGTSAYRVLGLGFVSGYREGYYILSGPAGFDRNGFVLKQPTERLELIEWVAESKPELSSVDERQRVIASVVRRQGQPYFRKQLLAAYEGKCAFTEYDAEDALEAAHIAPYRGPASNRIDNGLLLRADFHDLFDLSLVAVDTSSQTLVMSRELESTAYARYAGQRVHLPRDKSLWPSADLLDQHREQAGL